VAFDDGSLFSGTTIIRTASGSRQARLAAASTPSACCSACRRHPMCRGFSFHKRNKLCYLKTLSDAGGAWQRRKDADFASGMDPGPADPGVVCARGGCYSYIGCYPGRGDQVLTSIISSFKSLAYDGDDFIEYQQGCAAAALEAGFRCVAGGGGKQCTFARGVSWGRHMLSCAPHPRIVQCLRHTTH